MSDNPESQPSEFDSSPAAPAESHEPEQKQVVEESSAASPQEDAPAQNTDSSEAPEEKKEEPASFTTAIISLVNSTLGSGMLGIPLAYSKAGLVPAIVLHILMGLMSWASFYFLTYSSEATGVYSYGDVCFIFFLTD